MIRLDRLDRLAGFIPLLAALAGTSAIAVLVSINGLIDYDHTGFAAYDHHSYMAMAREGAGAPGRASVAPFCWRVLTPWIASLIPAPLPLAFYLITFSSVVGTALCIHALCRAQGHTVGWSLAGMGFFFSCFWGAGHSLWNYLMVDAVSLLILAAGLLVLEAGAPSPRRTAILAALLTVGALNKESWLILGAAVAVRGWRESAGGMARRAGAALLPLLPALAAMILLRRGIVPEISPGAEFPDYSLASVFEQMIRSRLESLPSWSLEAFYDPWGPLVVVPALLAPLRSLRWLASHPHRGAMVLMTLAQTFFGTSVGRLVAATLPVAAIYFVDRAREDAGPRPTASLGALFGMQMIFQYLRRTTLGLSIPPYVAHPVLMYAYAARTAAMVVSIPLWLRMRSSARGR